MESTEPPDGKEPTYIEDLPNDIAAALVGTEWVLVSLYGSSLLDGINVTLTVKSDGIGGFSGCNSYGGKATMDEGAFQVREVSSTAVGCAKPINRQEEAYRRALINSTSYRVQNGRLEMQDTAGETTLVYVLKG